MRFRPVAPLPRPEPLQTGVLSVAAAVFLLSGLGLLQPAQAQSVTQAIVIGAGSAKAASSSARQTAAASASRSTRAQTSPLWSELTGLQQQALAPLAGAWPTISEAQKRKWLVISQSFGRLPAAEQAKAHSRMTEWVALSPQQRTQARLNFAETQQLSPDDKKAKWEAYQALPSEEKRKFAAGAASAATPPATAAAVKPVPSQKLARAPKVGDSKPPRIAAAPNQVDHKTLLPQQAPEPTVAPSN